MCPKCHEEEHLVSFARDKILILAFPGAPAHQCEECGTLYGKMTPDGIEYSDIERKIAAALLN